MVEGNDAEASHEYKARRRQGLSRVMVPGASSCWIERAQAHGSGRVICRRFSSPRQVFNQLLTNHAAATFGLRARAQLT
jgi:hypothetical protein